MSKAVKIKRSKLLYTVCHLINTSSISSFQRTYDSAEGKDQRWKVSQNWEAWQILEIRPLTNRKADANRSSLVCESKHRGTGTDLDQKHNCWCADVQTYCGPFYVSETSNRSSNMGIVKKVVCSFIFLRYPLKFQIYYQKNLCPNSPRIFLQEPRRDKLI